jgi:hypothetical protein
VDVTNTGQREGDEVPQLYIHQRVADVTQPVMQLKGFERITLRPGDKRTVEFTVTPEMLSILNIDMHRVVEPGIFELMVGPSSDRVSTVRLTVANSQGETGRPALPPPPAGSESGVVSNFDDGRVAANYGTWIPAGDSMNGGKSASKLSVVEPGANGTRGALQIDGEVVGGQSLPFTFAGTLFAPGSAPMQPANLSGKKEISFWAKGDGKSYTLVVLTAEHNGSDGPPAMTTFVAGPEWKQYTFPFSAFDTDGGDLSGLGFVLAQQPGKFQFELDQVEIK